MIESILGFFLLWPVIVVIGIILSIAYIVATEKDVHGFAIFATIVALIAYCKPIFAFVAASWQLVLLGIAVYVLIGGVNSVFRWFRYCKEYIAFHPYRQVSSGELRDWQDGKEVALTPAEYYSKKLRPSDHKSQLVSWVVYWPWSLLWNLIGDICTAIYDTLANVYQKIADSVIRKATGNFGNYDKQINREINKEKV